MSCESPQMLSRFAAGELDEQMAERVGAHVVDCATCTASIETLSAEFQSVRDRYQPHRATERLRSSVRWSTRVPERRAWPRLAWGSMAALAAALIIGAFFLAAPRNAPGNFDQFAVRAHEAYLTGAAPLDVRTDDPSALAAEFTRRLQSPLHLPPMAGVGLKLLGGRLIQTGDQLAALLVYQQGPDVLSLTIAPRQAVALVGGVVERFRGVDFHFSEVGGRHVVQWTEGDSSYALVSSVAAQTRTSCGICHAPGSGLSNVDGFHQHE